MSVRAGLSSTCWLLAAALVGQPTYFRDEEVKVVAELQYGQTSPMIEYTDKPRYRGVHFEGHAGDHVDIRVESINGQALSALTDTRYKPLVSNFGSHIATVLPPGAEPYPNRYFVIFQEERRHPATFTVTVQKEGAKSADAAADYLACQVDSDCIAVAKAGCCNNGYKAAVNKDRIEAYRAANVCKTGRAICPQFMVDDQRVAHCKRHQSSVRWWNKNPNYFLTYLSGAFTNSC
jgi:hypothetical protein